MLLKPKKKKLRKILSIRMCWLQPIVSIGLEFILGKTERCLDSPRFSIIVSIIPILWRRENWLFGRIKVFHQKFRKLCHLWRHWYLCCLRRQFLPQRWWVFRLPRRPYLKLLSLSVAWGVFFLLGWLSSQR